MMHENPPQDIENSSKLLDATVLTIDSESTTFDLNQTGDNPIESKHLVKSLHSKIRHIVSSNIISDNIFATLHKMNLTLSIEFLRMIKFLIWTYVLIVSAIPFIRWVGWENDPTYSIKNFVQYDITGITLDSVIFFVVGRLYQRPGVDRLFPYLVPAIASCIYSSWINNIWFMKNSFTIYNVRYVWPWQLFVYLGVFGLMALIIVVAHIRASFRDCTLLQRAIEFSFTFLIFIAPFLNNSSFHLHHWYLSLLLAMHANREEWWSKLTMAIGWGWYINGIAAYGRDPILGCSAVHYFALGNSCDVPQEF